MIIFILGIIIMLQLDSRSGLNKHTVINEKNEIDKQGLFFTIQDIYTNFDLKKKVVFTTVPTATQIGEGQIVLYKSGSTYKLFTLIQGTTVSVTLSTS